AAERDPDHLEARTIMALEQLGDQASGRVLMEISAEIGNADPFVRPALAGPERSARRADLVVDEGTRALQVEGRIVAEPNEREWVDDPFAFGDQRLQASGQLRCSLPVAECERRLGKPAPRIGMVGTERDRLLVACDCLFMALELIERVAAAKPRLSVVG